VLTVILWLDRKPGDIFRQFWKCNAALQSILYWFPAKNHWWCITYVCYSITGWLPEFALFLPQCPVFTLPASIAPQSVWSIGRGDGLWCPW